MRNVLGQISRFLLGKSAIGVLAVVLAMFAQDVAAQVILITEIPNVRVERYSITVMWRLPLGSSWPSSSCPNLGTPSAWTDADQRLLFQAVMVAKITQSRMFFQYDAATCKLASYGMDTP